MQRKCLPSVTRILHIYVPSEICPRTFDAGAPRSGVHCFPLLIATSRTRAPRTLGCRIAPENEAKTMTYSCVCAADSAALVGAAHCYFTVNNNAARHSRCPESRASMLRSGLLAQAKNALADRALTDTEAAFSLARNGQVVPAIAPIVTSCFLRRAWSRAAPQHASKHAR